MGRPLTRRLAASRAASSMASLLLAAVIASSCGTPSFVYVRDPTNKAIFRIPFSWTRWDKVDFYRDQHPNVGVITAQTATKGQWLIGFDASPSAHISDFLSPDSTYPSGFAKQRPVDASEQTSLSTNSGLRNVVLPLDQQSAQNPSLLHIDSSTSLKLPPGFRGVRVVFTFRAATDAPSMTLNQTAIVDPGVANLYLLVIGCASSCYRQDSAEINQVVDSWTMKGS